MGDLGHHSSEAINLVYEKKQKKNDGKSFTEMVGFSDL